MTSCIVIIQPLDSVVKLMCMCYAVGKPKSFSMKVKPAAVFPLDVYILMDLSRSMEDDLRSLQQLANSTSQYQPLLTFYI